jgi:hypothetical protein
MCRSARSAFPKFCWRHPLLCRAFYPDSHGPHWARCMLGSDLKPRSITTVTDLGCWVLLFLRRSLLRISGVNAVTRTRRWMSLLTKLLEADLRAINSCWLCVPSSGFLNAVAGNGSALLVCFLPLACYAASAVGAPSRSGSYTSPLTHGRCNSTANFRATATAARFFAFFPPRSHNCSPYRRESVSGPNGPRI